MHLTQQQQLNQMCPPPLGPPTAWFMNHTQPSPLPQPLNPYHHSYHHQGYYNNPGSISSSTIPNSSTVINLNGVNGGSSLSQQQQNHSHQTHQPPLTQVQHNYNNYSYQQQQQQQQPSQQHHIQQQYNQIHPHQPTVVHQPQQSQHVQHHHHHQQQQQLQQQQQQTQSQSASIHHQQHQPQLSPHTTHPRPSPTLHHHQQPSPNFQQHSPHLTSPSLQPSPVLHHHPPQQQSPLNRHQQQTPPHHTPTPNSSNSIRPTSVKELPHHPSNILQTEIRILEINRRLQCRPTSCFKARTLPSHDQYDDRIWWDEFVDDFFKDDATLTIFIQLDDKTIRYVLSRKLIAGFFRSYFDGGVTELSINLKNSREVLRGHQTVVLDCDQANIITKNILKHPKISLSPKVVVCTEGHLTIEFANNNADSLMIKSWKFQINVCREYIDRSITSIGLPSNLLMEPTTNQGLTNSTLAYLRMCSVLEPMQELMSQHKSTNNDPKVCLHKVLFEKYRYVKSDDISKNSANKRRKRKPPASPAAISATTTTKKSKASTSVGNTNYIANEPSPPIQNLPPLNIMVVGEPSSMNAQYCDDNERSIEMIENPNYTIETESPIKSESSIDHSQYNSIGPDLSEREPEVIEKRPLDVALNHDSNSQQDLLHGTRKEFTDDDNSVSIEEKSQVVNDHDRQIFEEPTERENNCVELHEETHLNSAGTQSENHLNIMNSIPEDREDNYRSTSCDSIVSTKLPPSSISKTSPTTNGTSGNKKNRRASEGKPTFREGLMRTSDFVVALKDLKFAHPALWRICGNNLLQRFEPVTQNGVVLYENTSNYAGWNPEIRREYVGVDVMLTQHKRDKITLERPLINFQKIEEPETFFDKHFVIYLQILISTALDTKFWESIENEPKHHDYFMTSRRIIEDVTKRFKKKLSSKLKLGESFWKNVEKYPNLLIKPAVNDDKEQKCGACDANPGTQLVTFGNRSYDLHSFKPVNVTSDLSNTEDKGLNTSQCETCLEIVKIYSEIHHIGWKLYNMAKEKVELHRNNSKPINEILDECLKDEDWLATIYTERDTLWAKVEQIQ